MFKIRYQHRGCWVEVVGDWEEILDYVHSTLPNTSGEILERACRWCCGDCDGFCWEPVADIWQGEVYEISPCTGPTHSYESRDPIRGTTGLPRKSLIGGDIRGLRAPARKFVKRAARRAARQMNWREIHSSWGWGLD